MSGASPPFFGLSGPSDGRGLRFGRDKHNRRNIPMTVAVFKEWL